MTKKYTLLTLVSAVLIALAGCTSLVQKHILNLPNQNVPLGLSAPQVRRAVIRGATIRGWHVKRLRAGVLSADITVRGHYAKVTVPYSSGGYSIVYADSKNLDKEGNLIHRNYNRWVANLNRSIQQALAGTSYAR